jgi:hypothetical protein
MSPGGAAVNSQACERLEMGATCGWVALEGRQKRPVERPMVIETGK